MTHTPLLMSGPMAGSKAMGVYTSETIKDWIIDKLQLRSSEAKSRGSNISMVVADFGSGRGKACSVKPKGSQNAYTLKYRGNPVYHTSAGVAGSSNGVTLFYVNAQGADGRIIGIGHHISSDAYQIEWTRSDWQTGRTLQLA